MPKFAHTPPSSSNVWHLLKDHLIGVGDLAYKFAPEALKEHARYAGHLHDLGKYGVNFQKRLKGEAHKVDHWTVGGLVAFEHSPMASLCIEGHHHGLQSISYLRQRNPNSIGYSPSDSRNASQLYQELLEDGVPVAVPAQHTPGTSNPMLTTRMLYSSLVDADFQDTEAHFNREGDQKVYRQQGNTLDIQSAINQVEKLLQGFPQEDTELGHARRLLQEQCRSAADSDRNLFLLSAPTGSGKTLSMLRFALYHAQKHGLKRVILAVPYLSIMDQTSETYRKLFASLGTHVVLEDHSIKPYTDTDMGYRERRLSENWDAPIILTTNVQLLESLHGNRSSQCRKIHNIADSVLLLDESHTIPLGLMETTLKTFKTLICEYGCSIMLATASAPDYGILLKDKTLWNPVQVGDIFMPARIKSEYLGVKTMSQISALLKGYTQVLCITNTKEQTRTIYTILKEAGLGPLHLSTEMCPAHRKDVIAEVKRRLKEKEACVLVSTQCVEAGVDIDFPVVYRAIAPYESIIQAAGRCNRENKLETGEFFLYGVAKEGPDFAQYPQDTFYMVGYDIMRTLLNSKLWVDSGQNIYDAKIRHRYYTSIQNSLDTVNKDLLAAIKAVDFVGVSEQYRIIPARKGYKILTPYWPDVYKELILEAQGELTWRQIRRWLRKAAPLLIEGIGNPDLTILTHIQNGWYIHKEIAYAK